MNAENAFLRDIIEHPDDDTPRLVLADWLEEHDQAERAELIRAQHRLACLAEDDPGAGPLRRREREILNEHQLKWVEPLLEAGAVGWLFRRGFPAWCTLSVDDFLRHGQRLLEETTVSCFTLVDAHGRVSALAACPHLARVRKLELVNERLNDADLVALASSPHLGQLRELRLGANRIHVTGIRALAACPSLERLARLFLRDNPVGDAGVEVLAGSPGFRGLRRLDLSRCHVRHRGVHALAGSPVSTFLERLDLGGNIGVGPEGVRALARPGSFPALADLRLGGASCGDEGTLVLANSPLLGRLRRLVIGSLFRPEAPDVGPVGLGGLLSSGYLRGLRSLRIGQRPAGQRDLVSQPSRVPPAPDHLCLTWGSGGSLLAALREARLPPALTSLRLSELDVTADEVSRLRSWDLLSRLTHLELTRAAVPADIVEVLTPYLGRPLRRLRLGASLLGPAAIGQLLNAPGLSAMEEVVLEVRVPHPSPETLFFPAATAEALQSAEPVRVEGVCLDALRERDRWPMPWRQWLCGERLHRLLATERTSLGDADVEELARLPLLERLVELDLFQVRVGPAGVRALAASPHLRNLRSLRLSFSPVGDEGARLLAGSPHLAGLRTLKLSFCGIGDEGACALAASPYLTRLSTLKLWGCGEGKVGDEGARAMARSAALSGLVMLRLRDNAIGDAGAIALAESPYLRTMLDLSVSGNPIGETGMRRLQERFGRRLGLAIGEWDQLD